MTDERHLVRRKRIATRLATYFLVVSLLPLAAAGYVTYHVAEQALREDAVNSLLAMTDAKAQTIEDYARERRRNIAVLLRDPAFIDAIEDYTEAVQADGVGSSAYEAVDRKFRPFLTYYTEAAGYDDLLLATPDGKIIFSATGGLQDRIPKQESELSKALHQAKTLLETEISEFEVDPATGLPVAYIAAPVFKDSELVGLVAFQIRNDDVYQLVTNYNGLGETGDIVVAADRENEARFMAPTRPDPDAALGRSVSVGSWLGSPVQKAIGAHKGSGIAIDYRGEEVLAAWRYLPSFRWGIVVKIDTDEAFTPIYTLQKWWLSLGIFVIALVTVLTVVLARSISVPLHRLSEITKRIARGDLTANVDVHSIDEIGELADSFRHMQHTLEESIENLKETTAAKERIDSELRIAHDTQMSILPKVFRPFPGRSEFDIYATIEPAREVGGDFYDFALIDNDRLCFTIGDVSGKGVPASLFMAVTTTLLKIVANRLSQPDAVLAEVNRELCRENDSGMFVTIFFGILHIHTGELEYSNGGHNLPYRLIRPGDVVALENTWGMALGVQEDVQYLTKTVVLQPGDGLFLYTDGSPKPWTALGRCLRVVAWRSCCTEATARFRRTSFAIR